MSITRTAIVDDDGSRTTGTVLNNAWKQELYDQIDAAGGVQTIATARTDTGAVNNWAAPLAGNTYIPWNGAADVTFSGLAGGVAGQIVWVENITAAKVAYFLHASGLSSAANQFTNYATSGTLGTPIAPGGKLAYMHNGTNWRLIFHNQGAWITPTYAGGDYTAATGTWTVDAGDVLTMRYRLDGRSLFVKFWLQTTSVSATPTDLRRAIPGGFTQGPGNETLTLTQISNAGGGAAVGMVTANPTYLSFTSSIGGSGWSIATNTTSINGSTVIEVT